MEKIYITIASLILVFGIFCLIKNRKDYLWKKYIKGYFPLFVIFPSLDVLSTILFVSKLGILAEANPIGRLFLSFGNIGYLFMLIFSISTIFFLFNIIFHLTKFLLRKKEDKDKQLGNLFSFSFGIIVGIYTFVLITNFYVIIG